MSRVSVVIPTYNRAGLLQRAIESVLAQTYRDFEVIVVDDGSTDNTSDVCKAYPELKYLAAKHTGLPAIARNCAITASSGEYVAFLDSDDEWLPNKLAVQIKAMDESPLVGLICSNAIVATDAGPTKELYLRTGQLDRASTLHSLLLENSVVTSTAVVRRKVLESVGDFSEEQALRGVEDYDLWLRVAARSEVILLTDALALYRSSSTGLGQEQGGALHWIGVMRILARVKKLADLDNLTLKLIAQRAIVCHCMICDNYVLRGQYREFLAAFLEFLSRRPFNALSYLISSGPKVFRRVRLAGGSEV